MYRMYLSSGCSRIITIIMGFITKLNIYLSIYLSNYQSINQSLPPYLPTYPTYLPTYLPINLSINLYLSINPSIYRPIITSLRAYAHLLHRPHLPIFFPDSARGEKVASKRPSIAPIFALIDDVINGLLLLHHRSILRIITEL